VVIGLKILVEHFPQQRPGLIQFVLLILHGYPRSAVVGKDFLPGVEQFNDTVLNATKAFFPLPFVRKRLPPDTLEQVGWTLQWLTFLPEEPFFQWLIAAGIILESMLRASPVILALACSISSEITSP
jgi:hypothetical protein